MLLALWTSGFLLSNQLQKCWLFVLFCFCQSSRRIFFPWISASTSPDWVKIVCPWPAFLHKAKLTSLWRMTRSSQTFNHLYVFSYIRLFLQSKQLWEVKYWPQIKTILQTILKNPTYKKLKYYPNQDMKLKKCNYFVKKLYINVQNLGKYPNN